MVASSQSPAYQFARSDRLFGSLSAVVDPALAQLWSGSGHHSHSIRSPGGAWHKKYREASEVPHTSIDRQAHWTKSGWQGWVYGWKLHLITTVAAVWIPLAAELTTANTADSEMAPELVSRLSAEVRSLLGDRHYNRPELRKQCEEEGRILVTSQYGPYPHTDDGVEVRRIFHKLRSTAIENLNEQFKGIFDNYGQVPTKDLANTQHFAPGAILVYQLGLWYRFAHGLDLRVGLKAFLKAA